MEYFLVTLTAVGTMLLYAVPGYAAVKCKAVKEENISSFAFILMYVCAPCLSVYAFDHADYSKKLFLTSLAFFGLAFVVQAVVMLGAYFVLRKKYDDVKYRVATVATISGNCSFMGIPVLEAMFPGNTDLAMLSMMFMVGMNILGWTVSSAIITQNKKYISLKKAIINPSVLGIIVALPLFLTGTKLPAFLQVPIETLGKMSTPMCMIIMGMRLATVKMKSLFGSPLQYLTCAFKQLIFPLFGLVAVWFLPFDLYVKQTMFVICCTPVASVVLNFAELLGEGQETAANLVLLSTVFSVATIPVMTILLSAIS